MTTVTRVLFRIKRKFKHFNDERVSRLQVNAVPNDNAQKCARQPNVQMGFLSFFQIKLNLF